VRTVGMDPIPRQLPVPRDHGGTVIASGSVAGWASADVPKSMYGSKAVQDLTGMFGTGAYNGTLLGTSNAAAGLDADLGAAATIENTNSPRDGLRFEAEIGDPDEHFCVVIRVRPPLQRELASPGWRNVVTVADDSQICIHEVIPEANAGDRASGTAQVVTSQAFTFDHVYDRESSQPDIYSRTARSSVLSTLQGYNAAILAYGPTGTGKTYTMEGVRGGGTSDGRGIIPRSMEEIFQHIRHCRGPQSRFLVRASYLQIYNEVISDLLKPDRVHLVIREDRRRGVFVEGLSEWLCRSPSEVRTLMERGSTVRATAQTAMNDASSRSHAVFIVIVEQSDTLVATNGEGGNESERAAGPPDVAAERAGGPLGGAGNQRVRVGRLNLVDLAGSERPRVTGATGQRLEETKKINQSLSSLGNVIAALTERRPRQHIPYRDSKLTRLLEDSLGGNCRTTMIAMVSPAAETFAESVSTLKFAYRAKAIRTSAQVNEDIDQRTLLRRYEAELRQLRAELRERSRNVVDKRRLLEVEEERRRAEEDRLAAVTALEERSLVLEQEKAQKEKLEVRIRQMSSQLLIGGQQVEDTAQFRIAVAEQERIRSEYAAKLSELEKERSTIEEDKAQVGRYKQLLLKQRDIMVALTQRLHERDESIIALQDEIDSRDRHSAELEEQLDRRGTRLLALERLLARAGTSHETAGAQVPPDLGNAAVGAGAAQAASGELQYPPEHAVFDLHNDRPMKLLSADEKVAELTSLLDGQRQENHRLTLELEELQALPVPALPEQVSILDRIAAGLLEVTGPALTKVKLTQDVMTLKRLLAPEAAPSRGALAGSDCGAGFGASIERGGNAVGGSVAAAAAGAAAAMRTTISDNAQAASLASSSGMSGASGGYHHHTAAAVPALQTTPSLASAVVAAAAADIAAVGKHAGSPHAAWNDGSATPTPTEGSTPRAEMRGRRAFSMERTGEAGGRLRSASASASARSDKPTSLRRGIRGSGVGTAGGAVQARASSLSSSLGATSLKGSARLGVGAASSPAGNTGGPNSCFGAALRRSASTGRSSASGIGFMQGLGFVRAPPLPVLTSRSGEAVRVPRGSAGGAQPRSAGAWMPPATAAAVAAAGSTGAPTALGGATAPAPLSAEALREEAQRSVDALLARRRAELRRAPRPPSQEDG